MKAIPLVIGNWKMNKTIAEASVLVKSILALGPNFKDCEAAVAPPATALFSVGELLKGSQLRLCAQNVFYKESGAYTGELSPLFLQEVGCQYVLIGHSERRQYFGETDQDVAKKLHAALAHHLTPVVCVGETLQQRNEGLTVEVVTAQIKKAFEACSAVQMEKIVIAYEPIWAIGTGVNATPLQAEEVHQVVRESLADQFDKILASKLRILYGGSVKATNAKELKAQPNVNGLLVGGASLDAQEFVAIMRA
ncbi:MAG: triose-phosphate isomerase [Deltaproteobacteria bacterium]|nr:triose-phosphate isomerase [Deltaproteobacteria bacterium]